MNIIIDENLPPVWCEYLKQRGHHAVHWKDIGSLGDPDEVIFDTAQANGSVILTQNLDFTRMIALRGTKLPSLIQLRVDCPIPSKVGHSVIQILKTYETPLKQGALLSLENNQHRIRLLPLKHEPTL